MRNRSGARVSVGGEIAVLRTAAQRGERSCFPLGERGMAGGTIRA